MAHDVVGRFAEQLLAECDRMTWLVLAVGTGSSVDAIANTSGIITRVCH